MFCAQRFTKLYDNFSNTHQIWTEILTIAKITAHFLQQTNGVKTFSNFFYGGKYGYLKFGVLT